MQQQPTDWDKYYQRTPKYTSLTRSVSGQKLSNLLREKAHDGAAPLSICEIGGANSCFVELLTRKFNVSRYHIIDLNEFGLSLLKNKRVAAELTFERADVLTPATNCEQFDVVFSVGLIEHFDQKGTSQAIASHFERCRPGGIVLMTFPTPTPLYKTIRRTAELVGVWNFPDERPLFFPEVRSAIPMTGTIVHESINWFIGLTQGYILASKDGASLDD